MFVSFEGIDYSGKTTQATLLVERLKQLGKQVVFLREPGGTRVSEKIRTILLDRNHLDISGMTEILLFSAARAQLVHEVILPSLRAGKIVVCDRFYDSTTAYQGYGRGLNLEHVRSLNRIATSGTAPDITILIDINVQESTRRRLAREGAADRMESSGNDFYERVVDGYRQLADAEPDRIVAVDGKRSVEEIQEEVWNIIQKNVLLVRREL